MGRSLGNGHLIDNIQPIASTVTETHSSIKPSDATKLYRLMLVDEDTGLPQRAASLSEAQLIAQLLYKDAANSCLPCLRTTSLSAGESETESEVGSLRSAGHIAKQGGPCQHCGTSAVSSRVFYACTTAQNICQSSRRFLSQTSVFALL